jgi:SAM-dependent methyltransferase
MKYKMKNYCRCCKKRDLLQYLNLGKQPLANSYHKDEKLPTIPLEVVVCKNCFHNQLSVVVNPDDMFRNYLYVSGTTTTFKNHTKALAEDAVSRFKNKRLHVLDIACNDGTQLEYFRALGCDVMGVDPAENLSQITKNKKISVLVEYWSQKIAESMDKKFDIITGTNVFAHVDDLDDFLQAAKIVLKDDGFLILEFPYVDNMISHNEFDTVYHEHLSYFLVNSFKHLVERIGFSIADVKRTPIHGGSIRFFLQKGSKPHSEKARLLIKKEKDNGLLTIKTYKEFAIRVKKNKKDMRELIAKLQHQKKKVIGYAASAKGNTMLNYFKINLDYIIDDNDLKWESKTPGRNIPIKNPKIIESEKGKLYVVILAWNFYNEIAKRISTIRGHKNDFAILYVPEIELLKIGNTSSHIPSA